MSGIRILRSSEERISEMQISNHRTLTMSYKERERLNVLYRLDKGELRCADAAESLGISERQLYRLRGRYRKDGDEGLIHGLRGCLSNRGYGVSVRTRALELYRERYSDYGPTLFAEMIGKEHSGDLPSVDHETLRRWLDNSLHIFSNNQELSFSIFKEKSKPHAHPVSSPPPLHPWRQKQLIGKARHRASTNKSKRIKHSTNKIVSSFTSTT